jgi:hypothetical protein
MKTRVILFLAVSAITTLSFTFASIGSHEKPTTKPSVNASATEPVGGFMAEDKI